MATCAHNLAQARHGTEVSIVDTVLLPKSAAEAFRQARQYLLLPLATHAIYWSCAIGSMQEPIMMGSWSMRSRLACVADTRKGKERRIRAKREKRVRDTRSLERLLYAKCGRSTVSQKRSIKRRFVSYKSSCSKGPLGPF